MAVMQQQPEMENQNQRRLFVVDNQGSCFHEDRYAVVCEVGDCVRIRQAPWTGIEGRITSIGALVRLSVTQPTGIYMTSSVGYSLNQTYPVD